MPKRSATHPSAASPRSSLLRWGAWLLGATVCAAAITVWGHDYGGRFLPFSPYRTFPLLGLLAFSLMWSHYVVGTARELLGADQAVVLPYFRRTGYAVLVLILLHPGLLIYQRFRDGYGLPPGSYESYVAPGLGWITLLGTASLLVFIGFEFHRLWGNRRWWRYVADASDAAMLAIVYHGLRLGTQIRQGWFHAVWWFYAVSLVLVLARKYVLRRRAGQS